MDKITNVTVFVNDLLNLIQDYAPEKLERLTEDQLTLIAHSCDYEDLAFIVINNELVITADSMNGDVYSKESLDNFINSAIEQILNAEE